MTDTPWYMRTTDTTATDKGSAERNLKHVGRLAALASEEADAVTAQLRDAEAKGVAVPAEVRMSMGYATHARKAATQLAALPPNPESEPSTGNLTPEQRVARGYGA